MSTSDSLEEVLEKHNRRQWQDVLFEFNRVSEWVDKQFPSVSFTVEFNDDQTKGILFIKTRLMTGKDMDHEDQLLRKKTLPMTPEMWNDPVFMGKFIQNIYPSFTKSIQLTVNNWYNKKKESNARV